MTARRVWGATVAFSPPTEMVSEVKVQTATYDADVGRVPGGNMNMVLKTGTNQLHGVAQWFHTNQHFPAYGAFLPAVSVQAGDGAGGRC